MKLALLALCAAAVTPAWGTTSPETDRSAAESAAMIVLMPFGPCTCAAQENVSVTLASGTCTIPNSNPPTPHDCYVKTETFLNAPPADPNGLCYADDVCTETARPCSFRGFNITISQRTCHLGANCCGSGGDGTVRLDGVKQNTIGPGLAVGPMKCDPGAVSCGGHPTNVMTVTCGASNTIVFRVQASFDCNQCGALTSDG